MKPLPIVWQRLVSPEGKTCDRCNATYQEMQRAVGKLKAALGPLGIEPTLETREIDEQAFKADPSESNRIWIAGRPMEEWLGANVGRSRCCSVCGDSECRTVEVGGQHGSRRFPRRLVAQGCFDRRLAELERGDGSAATASAGAAKAGPEFGKRIGRAGAPQFRSRAPR